MMFVIMLLRTFCLQKCFFFFYLTSGFLLARAAPMESERKLSLHPDEAGCNRGYVLPWLADLNIP